MNCCDLKYVRREVVASEMSDEMLRKMFGETFESLHDVSIGAQRKISRETLTGME